MILVVNVFRFFSQNLFLGWLSALIFVGIGSCSLPVEQVVLQGETMGTTYSVKYYGGDISSADLQDDIDQYLENFNQIFSTYIPDSEISRLNRADDDDKAKGIPVTTEFQEVLDRALNIASRSEGYFDPTVYPLVSLWKVNFKKANGLDSLPTEKEISAAKERIGFNKVTSASGTVAMAPGMSIDLSAIAKGSGVDGLAGILARNGIKNYLVEIGGEIRVSGNNHLGKPWQVMIAPPWDETKTADLNSETESVVLSLNSGAVATSGDYLNYFIHDGVKYSHLINPHTGKPIRHYVTSVSVIADTCEEADAWATALIVMGKKGIQFSEEQGIPAIFIVAEPDSDLFKVIKNSLIKP